MARRGVRANQKVSEKSAWPGIPMFTSACRVSLKRLRRHTPNRSSTFQSTPMPVSRKKVSRKLSVRPPKAINSAYTRAGMISCPRPRAASRADSAAELSVSSRSQRAAIHVGVNDSFHWPRNSRIVFKIAFLPEPTRPFPIPLYLPKRLLFLTGGDGALS